MSFWTRIKMGFARFMQGRYGADKLSSTLLYAGFFLLILNLILKSGLLSLLSLALYIYALYRMFSRNINQRAAENQKYLAFRARTTTRAFQAKTRFQNRKQYLYYKCPNCKTWLKLPRGVGSVHVTCGKCGHRFDKSA